MVASNRYSLKAGHGQNRTYGLTWVVANPRNGKRSSRLFALTKPSAACWPRHGNVRRRASSMASRRHRSRCADQAAERFFSMGLAVSPSAGYARMNSRAFSGWAAFSQAPYEPSFKIANMRFSLPGCP